MPFSFFFTLLLLHLDFAFSKKRTTTHNFKAVTHTMANQEDHEHDAIFLQQLMKQGIQLSLALKDHLPESAAHIIEETRTLYLRPSRCERCRRHLRLMIDHLSAYFLTPKTAYH